ncbi:hypothetical protein [Microbulbifer epialgicus]|uniref:Uncharacterized protein n=1 Tax=Microbulbifer epialgicus TaxID=393907 RepID=A0ABV4NVM2_9GAMM
MYWSSLKITHPLAKWVSTSVYTSLMGIFLMLSGVSSKRISEKLYLVLDNFFWMGLILYVVSIVVFLYFRLAPRFNRMSMGQDNLKRLIDFIEEYPTIAREMSLEKYITGPVTFGKLKEVQKEANRKVVEVAKNSLIRRG